MSRLVSGDYRRICAKMGKMSGLVATAHKLARIIYALLTKEQAYVDAGQASFEEAQKKQSLKNFERRVREMSIHSLPFRQASRILKMPSLKDESFFGGSKGRCVFF